MKNVMQLYNYYFDSYKEKYDEEDLSEGNKKSDPKQFKINEEENNKSELAKLRE